jgi:asparagine synthase (glutamine-hydrolysing)
MDAEYGITHLYPFLDYRVVDFAFTIPRTMYLKNGINRYVFRKAFAGILPPEHAGYFTKDDPVKSDFLLGRNTRERMKNFAGLIDRPLFSPYINWGSLDRAIENLDGWEESWRQNAKLRNKLRYCLELQRELDGAADNPASDQV